MKQVLVVVRCITEDAMLTQPEVFYSEISELLKTRIRQLQASVMAVKAAVIEDFNHSGLWSDVYLESGQVDQNNWSSHMEYVWQSMKDVENPVLRVTDTEFWWTALPRYADDHLTLKTARIPIAFLDDDQDLYLNLRD